MKLLYYGVKTLLRKGFKNIFDNVVKIEVKLSMMYYE